MLVLEELQAIDEVGPVMAGSVVEYFKQPQVKKLLAKFKDAGLNLSQAQGSPVRQSPGRQKIFIYR